MASKKALCIDYGSKRIGISLSDDTATIAFPHKFIANTTNKEIFKKLLEILVSENIGLIVIGMPISLKGKETESSLKIKEFIKDLNLYIGSYTGHLPEHSGIDDAIKGIKIEIFDERFSTAQAQRSLISMDVKRKKRKQVVDSVASTLILQSFLDKKWNHENNYQNRDNEINEFTDGEDSD